MRGKKAKVIRAMAKMSGLNPKVSYKVGHGPVFKMVNHTMMKVERGVPTVLDTECQRFIYQEYKKALS